MSISSSRPRVRSISGTALTAGAAGAVAIAALIRACVDGLNSDESRAIGDAQSSVGTAAAALPPGAVVRQRISVAAGPALNAAVSNGVSQVGTIRASTLSTLAASSCVVRPDSVRGHLDRLLTADSPASATLAAQALMSAAEVSHQQVFVQGLATAVQAAAIRVGLDTVETSTAADGTLRVITSNEGGRALVTEITTTPDGHVAMESEVIGGDGRCSEIMDAFDRALEAEGVISDQPSRRRTGGVCDLAAAKAFVAARFRQRTTRSASKALTADTSPRVRRSTGAQAKTHNRR